MRHAPGWTLVTLVIEYHSFVTNDVMVNVFHYDAAAFPANQANADACATASDAYYNGGIAPLIGSDVEYVSSQAIMDDGVNQFTSAISPTHVTGTATGLPFPQVICGIIRKRAVGHGRRRFGHTCHPAVTQEQTLDQNNYLPATVTALTNFYNGLNDPSTNLALPGAFHVLYSPVTDTRQVVIRMFADSALKTQRRRTPGRGI